MAADLNQDSLNALVEDLGAFAGMVRTLQVDVSDRSQVENMVEEAVKQFGGLDILVNNAGVMDNLLPIAEMEDDVWERLLHINLYSVMYGTRKAVQYFLNHRREGVIINTASLSGLLSLIHIYKRHSAKYTGEKEVLKDCGEDGRHST